MAKTLGQQLDEINDSLSAARKSISYSNGDKEIHRSYIQLTKEKKYILGQIDLHGRDYIEGQNTTPKKAFAHVVFR